MLLQLNGHRALYCVCGNRNFELVPEFWNCWACDECGKQYGIRALLPAEGHGNEEPVFYLETFRPPTAGTAQNKSESVRSSDTPSDKNT